MARIGCSRRGRQLKRRERSRGNLDGIAGAIVTRNGINALNSPRITFEPDSLKESTAKEGKIFSERGAKTGWSASGREDGDVIGLIEAIL
jgi:hypothetical protein